MKMGADILDAITPIVVIGLGIVALLCLIVDVWMWWGILS